MEKTKKPVISGFSCFLAISGQNLSDLTLKHAKLEAKMSTTRSGEESTLSGPTLSYGIVGSDLSGPDVINLAMIHRLIGLIKGLILTAGPNLVA